MNIPSLGSREILVKDPSGVVLPQVGNEQLSVFCLKLMYVVKLFILFALWCMLQNFAPFPMNMPFYRSRESVAYKDPSGGLFTQVS